jgi:phytoene synthase
MTSPNADAELNRGPAMAYARLLTRTYSKSFYLATQFMAPAKKRDVYAVYAFCRYTDNIIDAPRSRASAELEREIRAWREELTTAYTSGESQHPVLGLFVPVLHKYHIPLQLPLELIDGVEMDLTYHRYDRFAQLRHFCYHVASVVGLMMTYVFGYRDSSAFPYAEALGIGMQLTNILRDVDEDWRLRGKIYLPLDEMREYGLTENDIDAGRMSEQMRSFIKAQVERAHTFFAYADHGIPLLERQGQTAVRAASTLYREILREIERADYDIFAARPVVSTGRKLRVLLRMQLRSILPGRRTFRGGGSAAMRTRQCAQANPTLPPVSPLD